VVSTAAAGREDHRSDDQQGQNVQKFLHGEISPHTRILELTVFEADGGYCSKGSPPLQVVLLMIDIHMSGGK
jgi:hypothetical protein